MDSTAMSWREHIRQNMRLALPLMIGQLATIGIWTSDTIAMGWIDSSSLAAGALASRFYQPFFFLALGISLAVGPLVAQGIGAGDERQVRRAFRQGMVIAVALGLVTAPLLLAGEQVLAFLGQDTELAAIGQPFLFWSSFGPTGVWGGLLLGLSVASLVLTMRMMRAMRRIRDSGRILLA